MLSPPPRHRHPHPACHHYQTWLSCPQNLLLLPTPPRPQVDNCANSLETNIKLLSASSPLRNQFTQKKNVKTIIIYPERLLLSALQSKACVPPVQQNTKCFKYNACSRNCSRNACFPPSTEGCHADNRGFLTSHVKPNLHISQNTMYTAHCTWRNYKQPLVSLFLLSLALAGVPFCKHQIGSWSSNQAITHVPVSRQQFRLQAPVLSKLEIFFQQFKNLKIHFQFSLGFMRII